MFQVVVQVVAIHRVVHIVVVHLQVAVAVQVAVHPAVQVVHQAEQSLIGLYFHSDFYQRDLAEEVKTFQQKVDFSMREK